MTLRKIQTMMAAFACAGIVCPPQAQAAQPVAAPPVTAVRDVALRSGGLLVGQVVNSQGTTQAGSPVSIWQNDREVVSTKTDANGVFAAQGLRGGQYQILAADGHSLCRLWAPDTAPPAAADTALVVSGQDVVRGQWTAPMTAPMSAGAAYGGRWLDWVRSHPYITAGIVAAAIAAPLAVAATDDDDDSSSGGPSS